MTWAKLDDQFPTHPKVMRAGPEASWLFVAGLCYCAQHLTDGAIPKCSVPTLASVKNPKKLAARLVEVGLWEEAHDDYLVHDYLAYNPARDEVEAERDRKRVAGAKGASSRWNGTSDSTRHGSPHETGIGTRDAPVPVPNNRRKRLPPQDYEPTDKHQSFALEQGLNLTNERDHWLDWCGANGRLYSDVDKGFSTWLRQAVTFGRGGKPVATLEELAEPVRSVDPAPWACRLGLGCEPGGWFFPDDEPAVRCECRS